MARDHGHEPGSVREKKRSMEEKMNQLNERQDLFKQLIDAFVNAVWQVVMLRARSKC